VHGQPSLEPDRRLSDLDQHGVAAAIDAFDRRLRRPDLGRAEASARPCDKKRH